MPTRRLGAGVARAALAAIVLLGSVGLAASKPRVIVKKLEAIEGEQTVVRIELSAPLRAAPRVRLIPKGDGQPDRLAVDLAGVKLKRARSADVGWGGLARMRVGALDAATARVVLELDHPLPYRVEREGAAVVVTLTP